MIVFPFWLLTVFLALMLKWTLNLSAFVLALPMLYIFGCGLYTLYCREWMQFLILLVAEFGCFTFVHVPRAQRLLLYHVPSQKTIAFLTKDTHKNFSLQKYPTGVE